VVGAAGGTNTLQVPTGTLDGIVDGAATDGDGEPTIVEEAVVDSAGNPVEGTNTPPADDPTVNSAGAAPTPGADDPAANVPTNGTNP
jgi:hypothetical protein